MAENSNIKLLANKNILLITYKENITLITSNLTKSTRLSSHIVLVDLCINKYNSNTYILICLYEDKERVFLYKINLSKLELILVSEHKISLFTKQVNISKLIMISNKESNYDKTIFFMDNYFFYNTTPLGNYQSNELSGFNIFESFESIYNNSSLLISQIELSNSNNEYIYILSSNGMSNYVNIFSHDTQILTNVIDINNIYEIYFKSFKSLIVYSFQQLNEGLLIESKIKQNNNNYYNSSECKNDDLSAYLVLNYYEDNKVNPFYNKLKITTRNQDTLINCNTSSVYLSKKSILVYSLIDYENLSVFALDKNYQISEQHIFQYRKYIDKQSVFIEKTWVLNKLNKKDIIPELYILFSNFLLQFKLVSDSLNSNKSYLAFTRRIKLNLYSSNGISNINMINDKKDYCIDKVKQKIEELIKLKEEQYNNAIIQGLQLNDILLKLVSKYKI